MNLKELLTAIANSIREKKGTGDKINAQNFPDEIASISAGIDTSDATATKNDILKDKTAYVDGKKIVGILEVGENSDYNAVVSAKGITSGSVVNMIRNISKLDTSNVTNMSSMFQGCSNLTAILELDTSNVTNMSRMFQSCVKLTTIPELDTSNVTDMSNMFYSCVKLTTIPELDASKVDNINAIFSYVTELTTFGGLKNLGKAYITKSTNNSIYRLYCDDASGLTHESLMNIINNLYDLNITYGVYDEKGQAGTGTLYAQSLQLGSTNKAKLTDEEIAIATAKGWTVS